ncbi:usg protein [Sinorhizobium meliloti]|uniref:usg protein n=1 Tax=Rhizobium meliloti TaxID=382 RepID=UPI000FDB0485|nr:usg protein [Sinorhizobium meliloti]RVO60705.1 aspartate-semialdehyde dehydrogenase [Sinorhizobium meliloti]
MRFSSDLERQLNGYGLTTAHILYRIPDFESVLQTYVWQDYDLAPEFPQMRKFLDFWQTNLDGPLHSVRFTHKRLIGPNEWRQVEIMSQGVV